MIQNGCKAIRGNFLRGLGIKYSNPWEWPWRFRSDFFSFMLFRREKLFQIIMTKFQVCKRNKVYILHLLIKKTQKFLDSIHSKEGMIVVNFTLSNYPLSLSIRHGSKFLINLLIWNQKFLNSFPIKSGGKFSEIFRGIEPNISDRFFKVRKFLKSFLLQSEVNLEKKSGE